MVVLFGISWPISIYKSWKSKTAKGKSLLFTIFIWFGYIFGIMSKLFSGKLTYVFIFYVINLCTVTLDMILYFKNHKLDVKRDAEERNKSVITY